MSLARDAFSLLKITPKDVLNKLLDCKYDSIHTTDLSFDVDLSFNRKIETPNIKIDGNRFEQKVISNGKNVTIAHVNNDLYQQFIEKGHIIKPEEYTCLWCRRKKHNEEPVRIPFKLEKLNNMIFVHVMFTTCTYNCALAEIENRLIRFPHDKNYEESKLLIKLLFAKVYPGKKLEPSPDYLILEDNGGPVSKDVYFSSTYTFKEDPTYVFVPAQRLYFFSKSKT